MLGVSRLATATQGHGRGRSPILDENPLTGAWKDVDKDITGVTSLFDTLKTSSVTELSLAE